MKILLTGQPHSGKSTLLTSLLPNLLHKQGFVTREILGRSERVGFKLVAADEDESTLAHVSLRSQCKVSKYFVDIAGLDRFIKPLFSFNSNDFLYIDEIGQMELFSDQFKKLVEAYLKSENNFLGTITSVYQDSFIRKIKSNKKVLLINLNADNRTELQEVMQLILENLDKFGKLTKKQQAVAEELARGYFKQEQFLQLSKLFRNALRYSVEGKFKVISDHELTVWGNTNIHSVVKSSSRWICDCNLFLGKGEFSGKPGECSHIQLAKLIIFD